MSGVVSLRHAVGEVEKLALAPMVRVQHSMPRGFGGSAFAAWDERRREVDEQAAKSLANLGAFVAYGAGEARLSYAGVSSTSTMGLFQAVRNWHSAALTRIAKGEGK